MIKKKNVIITNVTVGIAYFGITFMLGVVFKTKVRKFASKDYYEMHDLCFFFIF
jgi:hypothetical protein